MRACYSLIFAALLAAVTLYSPARAQTAPGMMSPTITVTGEGTVETAPDMATISLGVTSTARTAALAMAENAAQLSAVLENLKAAGIEARDLQTSGLSLGPNWSNSSGGSSRIDGYTASNQLSVRVRDLAKLGAILDAAVKDGANTLNNVQFGVADPAPMLDEARKRAVANARHRAELLTGAAGVALGPIASITESGSYNPQPQFQNYARATMEAVPMAEGELSLGASVTVVWILTQ